MQELIYYTKERFPVFTALFFSLVILLSINLYFFNNFNLNSFFYVNIALLFLFLFRVRIMDDIKDFNYDNNFHKNRAVQKGIISIKKLKKILFFVLLVELFLQFFLPSFAIYFYLFLIFYSFLMFKDFFNNKLSKNHFFLYILLHQLIFAFYLYYFFCIFNEKIYFPDIKNFSVIFFLFLSMYIYEISRKMNHRTDQNNNKTNDTYIYKWGRSNVLILLFSFVLLQILCLFLIFEKINLFLLLYILFFCVGFSFYKIREKNTYFIFMIIFALITFISYYFV